eukprot:SAG11_NODE_151_length_14583_cov_21.306200_5_plen_77_part_00
MASSQLFYFLGQQPAGLVLVELLEDPANADQVASMRELGLNDEAIREILGGGEQQQQPGGESHSHDRIIDNLTDCC